MKYLILIYFFSFLFNSRAQNPAPDFTLTDIDGVTRNLYTELDFGKTVILDFFITNCGTCQVNTSILENFWQEHGYNGDSVWVWSIEINGVSDSAIHAFYNQFPATFPSFSTQYNNSVVNDYGVTYAPQYIAICPNRFMKQVPVESIQQNDVSCPVSGVSDNTAHSQAKFYYSMDESVLKINFLPVELPAVVSFYSQSGALLFNKRITEPEPVIDMKSLDSGLYFISLNPDTGNHFSGKILKLF